MSSLAVARKQGDPDMAYDIARQKEVDREEETPRLSSSIAKIILSKSLLHAWHAHPQLNPNWREETSAEFDYGTAAHALLLEGDESKIAVIEADDWRTKAAKEARDAARSEGKTPMLSRQIAKVRAMVKAAQTAINDCPEIAPHWNSGRSEVRLLWKHGNVRCASRLDKLSADNGWIFDYKTAENAEPDAFIGAALRMGYDVQDATYRLAVRAEYRTNPKFVFVVQEKDEPYAVSFVAFDPALQEMAEKKFSFAAALWQSALERNEWRGYPKRIAWAIPPAWYMAKAEAMDLDNMDERMQP